MPSLRFELRAVAGEPDPYFWRIVSTRSSLILATSQQYSRKIDAEAALNLVYYEAHDAIYTDYTQ